MSLINRPSGYIKQSLKLLFFLILIVGAWNWQAPNGLAAGGPPVECADGIYCPPPTTQIPTPSVKSRKMPDPNDFTQGAQVSLVVALCDNVSCTGGHQLDAQTSIVRLFVTAKYFNQHGGFSFTISDGKGSTDCGAQDDISTTNNTNFSLEKLKYLDDSQQDPWTDGASIPIGANGGSILTSAQAGCGDKVITVTDHAVNAGSGQYAGYYGYEFTAKMTSGAGWNSFKLSSGTSLSPGAAFFSYYAGAGDHFALKSAPNTGTGDFELPFAPNCSAGLQTQKELHWYDADAGLPNQLNQNPVRTTLWGVNYAKWLQSGKKTVEQTSVDLNIYANTSDNPVNQHWDGTYPKPERYQYGGGGGNKEGGWFNITLKTGWIYSWTWSNVNNANGIQFSLPYDSFNAYGGVALTGNCWTASCTATPADASLPVGSRTTIAVQLTNTSATHLKFPASFELRQTTPSGSAQDAGNIYYPSTRTLTYDIQPRASPVSQDFEYTLYSDSGNAGDQVGDKPLCSTNITWGQAISVTCKVDMDDVEPGQSDPKLYRVTLTATGNGPGGDYSVKLDPQPGATVSAPNPQTVTIADNPGSSHPPYSVNFAGYLTYGDGSTTGGFTATVTDPGGGIATTCSGNGTPATRPYFVVRGGDISTGGGFESANGSCNGSGDPPYVTPAASNYTDGKTSDNAQDFGGLRAFSNPSSNGASADFGVDALGEIYKNPSAFMGFYSGVGALFANVIPSSNPDLTSTSMGGYLNSNSNAHCVPDFFDTTTTGSVSNLPVFSGGRLDGLSGQYQAPDGVTITHSNINKGQQVTIYVDGDVTIDGDIINATNWNPTDPHDVPFLTIIAKGNITLTSNVFQVDGLFIAQPTVTNGDINNYSGGQFNTCDDFCPQQLVVNGAVIAQEVHLLRAHGTLGGSNGLTTDDNNLTTRPAEIFNYTPAMVIGVPAFNQSQNLNNILEGLFSLPPVF